MNRKLFGSIFGLRKSREGTRDGSSRRGREGSSRHRPNSDRDDPSLRDSSTHSALFDLELSQRGVQVAEREGVLARLQAAQEEAEPPKDGSVHGLLQRVIYLGRPLMEFELDLLQDLKSIREVCSDLDGLVLDKVAEELEYLGYVVELRRNNPTDPGYRHNIDKGCLEKLRHVYIVCHGRRDGSVTHTCIVEPRFREQFQVGHPTLGYTSLLKAVPIEFVGSPLRLQALVNLLCAEIAGAYASQELPLPPWRKNNAMLSKWFTPADMAVGAAVASGVLSGAPVGMPEHEALPAALPPPLQPQPLPHLAPAPRSGSGSGSGSSGRRGGGSPELPGGEGVVRPPPSPAVPPHATLGGPVGLVGGSSWVECPSRQGMHFFEALSLHQAALRQQQQQHEALHRTSASRSRSQQAQQVQQQQQLAPASLRELSTPAAAAALPPGEPALPPGEPADARVHDRTNRPRRRMRDAAAAQQQHAAHWPAAMPASAGAGGSLWGPQDEAVRAGGAYLGAAGGPAAAGGASSVVQGTSSWTDLSTILETRSAQSSPAVGSLPGEAIAAALGGQSRASSDSQLRSEGGGNWGGAGSESAYTSASSRSYFAGAGGGPVPMSTTGFNAMPVAAFAGEGLGPGVPLPGGAGPSGSGCSRKGGKRVVSLLARGLKSMGQKQTWTNLLPNVSTARRQGPGSREGSSRGGDRSRRGAAADRSWRGAAGGGGEDREGSSKQGKRLFGGMQRPPPAQRQPQLQQQQQQQQQQHLP